MVSTIPCFCLPKCPVPWRRIAPHPMISSKAMVTCIHATSTAHACSSCSATQTRSIAWSANKGLLAPAPSALTRKRQVRRCVVLTRLVREEGILRCGRGREVGCAVEKRLGARDQNMVESEVEEGCKRRAERDDCTSCADDGTREDIVPVVDCMSK